MDRSTVALTICRKRQANFVCVFVVLHLLILLSAVETDLVFSDGPPVPEQTHSSDRERRAGLVLPPAFSTNSRQEVADAGDACARPYIPSAQMNHWIRLNSHRKRSSHFFAVISSLLLHVFATTLSNPTRDLRGSVAHISLSHSLRL